MDLRPDQMVNAFRVVADRAVAVDSPDHQLPWGTRRDNSRNPRFNQKLNKLFAAARGPLWVLDLGCAGGGFVKDCLDDGCLAVGIEGSDFSKRWRRAEWRTIPEFLFTADITRPFRVEGEFAGGWQPVQFDVVTSWEVIEHIAEADLPQVAENVRRHLRPHGLWILSVSPNVEVVQGVTLHQTVRPRTWWVETFRRLGFENLASHVRYFNTQFVRGPKYAAPRSFHLVLSPQPSQAPPVPREPLLVRLYDAWLGSRWQRWLKWIVVGM